MKFLKSRTGQFALAALTTAILAACGGGSTDNGAYITSVKVFGDSLADGGTFATYRATVQSGDAANPTPMYPDLVSKAFGLTTPLCQVQAAGAAGVAVNPAATTCTNYAVGGGRVLDAREAYDVTKQLALGSTRNGGFVYSDLLLIDGGGNDAADLVGAYLAGGTGFATFLSALLPAATVSTLLAPGTPASQGTAGGAYMQALADRMTAAIQTSALDKGAKYVVVLNAPAVTNTPRFKGVLANVSAAYGGGATGTGAAAGVEGLAKSWVEAYNAQLAKTFKDDKRVVIVDFYGVFNDQMANPAKYGLTNVVDTACPATGVGADGLPTYTFPTCTVAALNATAGKTSADWWTKYLYSDGFHPTPYGHTLLAENIKTALESVVWIK